MEFAELISLLEKRLQKPLPGKPAQFRMSSHVRIAELMKYNAPEDARQSSVLILLYPRKGGMGLVLMLRPEYSGIHSGQISLPGGKSEETDESLIYTALREAREEIGIDPVQVQIIGQLTEIYVPPSNFMITPVVGYQASQPLFVADPKEVARIIEIQMEELLEPLNRQMTMMKLTSGIVLEVPSYCINGDTIWGVTAMILSELQEIISEIRSIPTFKAS